MTTSGKRFIQNQTKRPVLELSTGTDKEPKPIEITAAEAQTISDATTKPQIQSSAIQNLRQQTKPATISPAERYQTSQTNRELETYQEDMQILRDENALSSVGRTIGDLQLSAQVAFDTMGTSDLETERERARQQFEKARVNTLSYAKPILEKDEATQGLIESAKTGKTNMFEAARKGAAEFGAGSAINTTFPNQWVSDNGDSVYFMNSKSTVTKPTLKNTLKFENSRIQDAYNGITYNFAQNGQMYTVQEIKDYYTEWQNVPDDVVQQFIYDACHDVQTGERRNIDLYAEYYPALSNGDKYVNQKDSLLQLLTDDNFIEYGLSEYLAGKTATGEDIDPTKSLQGTLGGEDITKILQAALTITEAADELNEVGANITQATDYAIAKTYADQFPIIKEALDTFDRINISNEDFQKLVDNYNSNIGNIRQQFRYYGGDKGLSLTEYRKKVDDLVQENMREFNEEFINSWNKERIQGSLDYVESNIITDFFMGNAYRANDGKWYDRNGNEVERNDVNIGLANKYLETFRSFTQHATELEYDTAFAVQDPSRESVINILSDSVGMAFDVFMMGKGGIELQTKFEIPYIGSIYQLGMDATMDQAGEMVLNLANLTLFHDGKRTPESQEKFKEAAGGLVFMLGMKEIAKTKGLIRESIKDDIYRSALWKSIKSYTDELAKGLREIDVEGDQAKILQQQQTEPKPGENAKAEKQIESEKTNQKIMFIRNILEKAKKEFNKTFQEELSKEKGDRSIVDTLWNAAINLRQSEKATADTESRITREQEKKSELEQRERDIDNEIINAKGEGNTDLVEQLRKQKQEIKNQIANIDGKIERLTEGKTTLKDKTDEIVESVREAYGETVEGFREWGEEIATPEVRVEETTTEAPKEVEGTANVKEPQGAKETKTIIAKILDVIQSIQDNAKGVVEKIKNRGISKESKQRIDYYVENKIFDKETAELMENSPFSEKVLDIINSVVAGDYRTSIFGRKKAPKKTEQTRPEPSTDEIQRDVLSEGMKKLQEAWDRLHSIRKTLGKLYDYLSKEKTIDTIDFIKGEELTKLLNDYGFKIDIVTENGKLKAEVNKIEDVDIDEVYEAPIKKYVEHFINDILRFEMKSEKDVKLNRSSLKWNESTFGNRNSAFENSFREAFNAFLDRTGNAKLLRKLDAEYHNLKENLDTISMLFDKNGNVRNKAKNEILKREDAELDQLEYYIPGIKDLVKLTKAAPKIVKKGIDAKYSYKPKRDNLSKIVRYTFVYGGSIAAAFVSPWIAPIAFSGLEILGNKAKKVIQGKTPDWEVYDKMVESLKIDGSKKSELKRKSRERYDELSKEMEGESQEKIQKIMEEATQILIDREAARRMDQRTFQNEIEQRRIERENKEKQSERERQQQPIENALPGMKPDIATAEGEVTLGIGNPINPETLGSKGVKQQPKPIKEVKETYKDKEKTQQGYTQQDKIIIEASLGKDEGQTYDPKAEKVADILESQLKDVDNATRDSAINSLEEKGEEITEENIEKEKNTEPSSIEEFIMKIEEGAPEETTNYDGADIKDLEEVVANPKKYPNVDIEAAKSALEKARRQNIEAEIMQSPDQQQAQKEMAGIYKGNQMEREGNKGREKQREDMVRETNRDFDTLETTEEYDRIESQITPEEGEQAKKYAKGYKGFYRSDKAKTDTLRADMGKKPSQNITYTNSADKIATLENPTSRARVAQERLNKRKRLSEEEKTQLNQIIEQANVEIQAKEELKAQKTELANEYKALEKKRSETPYRETKKEITKQMDKISDEFDKLTYEEQGQFAKPKEVEAEEIKEAEKIEEEKQNLDQNETPQKEDAELNKEPADIELDRYHENRKKQTQESIKELEEKIPKREKAKEEANGDMSKWNIFDDSTLEQAKKRLEDLKKDRDFYEKNQVASSEKVAEGEKETKSDKLSKEERKQLNQINKEIEDSLFYKGGTDARGEMTDREKIDFTNTLSPYKEFYHASDSNIKEFDLDKTKDDPNGIGLSVSTKSDNAYTDKKHQYTIDGKGLLIAKEGITISKEKIKQISEKLGIEPNEMWQYVPLAELSSFIKGESGKSNKEVIETMRDVTKYDGVETSHDYVLLWNMDKVNPRTKKNKGGDKPEEPTTPKKPEPKNTPGSEPLVKIESDMSIYKEPIVGDFKTKEIFDRMEYIKNQAKEKGKLYAKEATELKFLQDLYKRQIEWEGREKQGDITDEDYVKAYETGGGGVDKAPF